MVSGNFQELGMRELMFIYHILDLKRMKLTQMLTCKQLLNVY